MEKKKMPNNKIKFSIIMPFYNSEAYIKDAILSVVNQTYKNWELIAVNDGSTDSSFDMVKSFCDDRIKIINKPNGGYVSAVNEGLNSINGDYFLLLGSDDELTKDILQTLNGKFANNYPDVAIFKVIKNYNKFGSSEKEDEIDPCTNFNDSVFFIGSLKEFSLRHKNEAAFLGNRDTGKVYKTEKLNGLRYFGKYGFDADGIFSSLFAHSCSSFMIIPKIGYIWHLRGESLSSRELPLDIYWDRISNFDKYFRLMFFYYHNDYTWIDKKYVEYSYIIVREIMKHKYEVCRHYFKLRCFFKSFRRFYCISLNDNKKEKRAIFASYFPLLSSLFKIY